jgi:hypothetical protein
MSKADGVGGASETIERAMYVAKRLTGGDDDDKLGFRTLLSRPGGENVVQMTRAHPLFVELDRYGFDADGKHLTRILSPFWMSMRTMLLIADRGGQEGSSH